MLCPLARGSSAAYSDLGSQEREWVLVNAVVR
jgi:hypothetical protein